jgi:hypothetical protein
MRYIMRKLLTLLAIVFTTAMSAQAVLSLENPTVTIENKKFTLVDVNSMDMAEIKYEEFQDNKLIKSGTYLNNKVHGVWNLYDENKNVISSVTYNNGKKISHSTIIENKTITVRYLNNRPINVITEVSLASN